MTGGACSCGEAKEHIVARRQTADGVGVCVWSDGQVTGYLGVALPGCPLVRPKTAEAVARERRAAWMLAEWVSIYDLAEVGDLYRACRLAARRGISLREAEEAPVTLRPSWSVYSTDRDGNPVERVWRLPRLRWPGLVVWDHCGRAGSGGGRYELMRALPSCPGTYVTTGIRFATLADLSAHLMAEVAS